MAYMLTIKGRKPIRCATLADASATYGDLRDKSRRGASTWTAGAIVGRDGTAYTVSYNGKVWAADGSLVFNPY